MAGCLQSSHCFHFSFKLALLLSFTVLRAPCVFITADDQNGWIAECKDEAVSSWHSWWYPLSHAANGTKCNIWCPLNCSCSLGNFTEEVIIKCPHRNMSVAHVSYPSNVTYLSWAHNNLYNISKESFCGVAHTVEEIHLNSNNLQHLQPGAFECLQKLMHLDLRHNLLEKIKNETFRGLAKLTWLDMNNNSLKEIQPGVFGQVNKLQWLDLSNNLLGELQVGVFLGLEDLSKLHLENNMLQEIERNVFKSLENLFNLSLHSNKLKEIKPGVFNGLGNLSQLSLHSNKLEEIESGVFNKLGNLSHLYLHSNLLKEIHSDAFKGLGNLFNLSLYSNKLKEIRPGAFNGLGNLSHLFLFSNMLEEIKPGVFNGLRNLSRLFLYSNMLKEVKPGAFSGMERLKWLVLGNNMLTKLLTTVFGKLTSLVVLTLADNSLASLHPDTFQNLTGLDWLSLRNINLLSLPKNIFQALRHLRYLDLSANKLKGLRFHPFEGCTILETLNLTQNPLQWIEKDAFGGLNVTAQVLVDNYATCCFVRKATCHPVLPNPPYNYLTCGRLLPYYTLRVGIWIVSILAIVTNVLGTVIKCKQSKQVNKVQFLLITNLSISDFLMGVYLIILLSVDLYYTDYFPSHSEAWRNSTICKIAGSLSVLSSEVSVFLITLISIDRFLRVKFPFGQHWFSNRSTKIVLTVLWLVAFGISISSFVLSEVDSDVYNVPEICVGLPISKQYTYVTSETLVQLSKSFENRKIVLEYQTNGSQVEMYFSIAVFTVLNLACFLIVGFCYAAIFILTWLSAKKSGLPISRSEIRMAKKMFLLVLTDFCCWVPIGVLSILVQAGAVEVNPVAYAWIATFILPVNSSINPFLYTLGDVIADKVTCSCKLTRRNTQDTCDYIEAREVTRQK